MNVRGSRLLELQPQAAGHAAGEGQPRELVQQRGAQETRSAAARHVMPSRSHIWEYADPLHHLAEKTAVARLAGMAPCRNHVAASRQGLRNPPVEALPADGILSREPADAMLLQQRVQTPHGTLRIYRHQESVESRERLDSQARVGRFEDLVHQFRVDPVEDRQIEQQRAVPVRQAAQQARVEKVPGERLAPLDARGRAGGPHAPIDAQRHGPPGRAVGDVVQLPSHQVAAEEPGTSRFEKRSCSVRAPSSMAPSTCQWSLRYQMRSWLMSVGP